MSAVTLSLLMNQILCQPRKQKRLYESHCEGEGDLLDQAVAVEGATKMPRKEMQEYAARLWA